MTPKSVNEDDKKENGGVSKASSPNMTEKSLTVKSGFNQSESFNQRSSFKKHILDDLAKKNKKIDKKINFIIPTNLATDVQDMAL